MVGPTGDFNQIALPTEETTPPAPTVTVIVPVYNGGPNFQRCLTSLTQAVPCPLEIIVVADGDTDGSWQTAVEFGAKTLRLQSRTGPACARNAGARVARGDILFFVDADVEVPRDVIGQLIAVFRREPDLAAVFGSYDDEPAAPNFLSQYKNLFHHYIHQTAQEEASTFWGACGAIRREVFFALGGFNENYRDSSIEDIELGYRLSRSGHAIRLCKTLQVKHLKRWDVLSLLKADILRRALPWTQLILQSGHFPNDLNIRWASRSSIVLLCLLAVAIGCWHWWPETSVAVGGGLLGMLTLLNLPRYRGKRQ